MKPSILNLLWIIAALLPGLAAAANLACRGRVERLLVYGNGYVNVRADWRDDFTYFCNVDADWKSVSATSCLAWVDTIREAMVMGLDVIVYYSGIDVPMTCSTLGRYGEAPGPLYVGVISSP